MSPITDLQREGLKLSLTARQRKVEIKRQLQAREVTVLDVLDDPVLHKVYLRALLGWQRNWGTVNVAKAMARLEAYNPTCGQVTARQRGILARLISGIPNEAGI